MNYVERGAPDGVPVVFVHGFPFSLEMWDPQMRALPNHFRAIAYDVRGHGQSDVGDGQYSIEFFVDDLMALLDHLVIEKATFCGLSMGGYIVLRAYERHPERFNDMILCDTKSAADTNEGKAKRAATLQAVKTNGVDRFADDFVKSVFAESTFKNNPGAVERIKSVIKANSPIGIGGTILALAARTDTTPVLEKISVPTLILCGDHDVLTTPGDARFMQEHIKGSTLHIVPDASHLSNLENPKYVNENLLAFLKQIN